MSTCPSHATETNSGHKSNSRKDQIIQLGNELLYICRPPKYPQDSIPVRIESIRRNLKANLYVYFYENICNAALIDKKWPSTSNEDDVHNTQAVIDSLSLDVLHEDLSYLTGEAICKPNFTQVEYLLEIFRHAHEWISSRHHQKEEETAKTTTNTSTDLRTV